MNNPDIGKLVLRLTLGLLMLLHGINKLHSGVGWIAGELASHNLPGFLAYGVFVGELIAPLMVLLGFHRSWPLTICQGSWPMGSLLGKSSPL